MICCMKQILASMCVIHACQGLVWVGCKVDGITVHGAKVDENNEVVCEPRRQMYNKYSFQHLEKKRVDGEFFLPSRLALQKRKKTKGFTKSWKISAKRKSHRLRRYCCCPWDPYKCLMDKVDESNLFLFYFFLLTNENPDTTYKSWFSYYSSHSGTIKSLFICYTCHITNLFWNQL